MKNILITNNKYVYNKYKDEFEMVYDEKFTYLDVLEYVRNKVHDGHELLTHPLSGSVKPNETPFKSIVISEKKEVLDFNSLKIIEDSIATYKKFTAIRPTLNWPESILDDFMVIDLSLIQNAIDRMI